MSLKATLLGQILCPLAGVLMLAYGGYRQASVVSERDVAEVTDAVQSTRRALEELQAEALVPEDRFAAQLPLQFELGQVLDQIRRFAAECDVRSIEFEVRKTVPVGGQPESKQVALIPIATGGSMVSGAVPGAGDKPREAKKVRCRFGIRSSFAALVRFIGQVEMMTPLATIAGIKLVPTNDMIDVELSVDFCYLPGEG